MRGNYDNSSDYDNWMASDYKCTARSSAGPIVQIYSAELFYIYRNTIAT